MERFAAPFVRGVVHSSLRAVLPFPGVPAVLPDGFSGLVPRAVLPRGEAGGHTAAERARSARGGRTLREEA